MATQRGIKIEQAVDAIRISTVGSAQIREIITVIDGITFQTNSLALSAASEAAPAGESVQDLAAVTHPAKAHTSPEEPASAVSRAINVFRTHGQQVIRPTTAMPSALTVTINPQCPLGGRCSPA